MIKEKRLFCPTCDNVKIRNCPCPPSTEIVRQNLIKTIDEGLSLKMMDESQIEMFANLKKALERAPADRPWMLEVLATISQGCEFFNKSYMPPPPQPKNQQNFGQIQVDNNDGFFTGLPVSMSKKKFGGANLLLTPLQRQQQKIAKIEKENFNRQQRYEAEKRKYEQMIQDQNLAQQLMQVNLNCSVNVQSCEPSKEVEMNDVSTVTQQKKKPARKARVDGFAAAGITTIKNAEDID